MSDPTPSRISQIVDWLYTELAAAVPQAQQLLDPDDLFENPPELLARGWGISIGAAENSNRCLSNDAYYYRRDFTVVLTYSMVSLEGTPDLRKAKAKLALEDLNLVLKRLRGSNTIMDGTTTVAFSFSFQGDSGPKPIVVNGEAFVFIELTVSAEYREPI